MRNFLYAIKIVCPLARKNLEIVAREDCALLVIIKQKTHDAHLK